jgi:nicotinamidase-related amidase
MARIAANKPTRDRAIEPESTALLLVDVQNAVFNDKQAAIRPEFDAVARETVLPNLVKLIRASRAAGIEVI